MCGMFKIEYLFKKIEFLVKILQSMVPIFSSHHALSTLTEHLLHSQNYNRPK